MTAVVKKPRARQVQTEVIGDAQVPEPKPINAKSLAVSKIEAWLQEHRTRSNLMIFCGTTENGNIYGSTEGAACTAWTRTAYYLWDGTCKYMGMGYNGATPADVGSGGTRSFYERVKFSGNEMSLRWLEFIMDENGPFKNVIPHIVNRHDLKQINYAHGFVFERMAEMPSDESMAFAIASRFAQEQNRRALVWDHLVQEDKVDPRVAFVYASWYSLDGRLIAGPGHALGGAGTRLWGPRWINGVFSKDAPAGEWSSKTGWSGQKQYNGLGCHKGDNHWIWGGRKIEGGLNNPHYITKLPYGPAARMDIINQMIEDAKKGC